MIYKQRKAADYLIWEALNRMFGIFAWKIIDYEISWSTNQLMN